MKTKTRPFANENLINNNYGKLIVVEKVRRGMWRCLCECGNYVNVGGYQLKKSKTVSCGCSYRTPHQNLEGKVFNRLTVLNYVGGGGKWRCKCECQAITLVNGYHLKNSLTKSCGCLHTDNTKKQNLEKFLSNNLIDKRFGKLLVIGYEKQKFIEKRKTGNREKYKHFWKCQCDCGEIRFVSTGGLNSGTHQSCGCAGKMTPESCRISTAKTIFRSVYSDGNLTFDQFLNLSQKPCYYCGVPPSNSMNCYSWKLNKKIKKFGIKFIYNGLDRVDSKQLHNLSNVVPCCKQCNFSKRDLPLDEFITWVKRISNHITENENDFQLNK